MNVELMVHQENLAVVEIQESQDDQDLVVQVVHLAKEVALAPQEQLDP